MGRALVMLIVSTGFMHPAPEIVDVVGVIDDPIVTQGILIHALLLGVPCMRTFTDRAVIWSVTERHLSRHRVSPVSVGCRRFTLTAWAMERGGNEPPRLRDY